MGTFRLAEHFVSINGEGRLAGELALFLRFTGCNLRCDWCDTMWANEKDAPYTLMDTSSLAEIAKQAYEEYDVHNVTLTGGEPLLQEELPELCRSLASLGLNVEIETNGAVPLAPFLKKCEKYGTRPALTMDYKLPSSKMEKHMCTENFRYLKFFDTLKFVCGSRADLDRAAEIIEEYKPESTIFLSPVFGRIEPAEMVEFMKERKLGKVRLQIQLHKVIWDPEMKGV